MASTDPLDRFAAPVMNPHRMDVAIIASASIRAASSIRCHLKQPLCRRKQYTPTCKTPGASRQRPTNVEITGLKACMHGKGSRHPCFMARTEFPWLQRRLRKTTILIIRLPHRIRRRVTHLHLILKRLQPHMSTVIRLHRLIQPTRTTVGNGVHPTMTLTMRVRRLLSLRIRPPVHGFLTSHGTAPPMDMTTRTRRTSRPLHHRRRRRPISPAILTPALRLRPHAGPHPDRRIRMIHLGRCRFATTASPLHRCSRGRLPARPMDGSRA